MWIKRQCQFFVLLAVVVPVSALAMPVDTTHRAPDGVVRIREVVFSGNRRTKSAIISRELDLAPGDTVRLGNLTNRLQRNAQRIFNTQLFTTATVTADSVAPDERTLRVVVKENWYVWAAPYARLNDRNLNEWIDRGSDFRRLNYGLFLDHENLFGRLHKFEFVLETGFTNRFTLRYNIPYLNRRQTLGLFTEFRYQSVANIAYNTVGNQLDFMYRDEVLQRQSEGHVKLRWRRGFYTFHYADLSAGQTSISESLGDLNPFYLRPGTRQQRVTSVGYTYRFDNRDNINFPLRGRTLITDIRRLGLLPTDDFRSWQYRLAFADYYPLTNVLGRKWYVNYILKAKAFNNPDVPYNLLRGIGYEEDVLRGYDLYVVNGSAYTSGRVNLKREVFRRNYTLGFIRWKQFNTLPVNLYLNAFSDWGYVYYRFPSRLDNPLANRWLRSAGLGLEINTWYNTVVRLNVSRNTLQQTNFFINLQKDVWTRWN